MRLASLIAGALLLLPGTAQAQQAGPAFYAGVEGGLGRRNADLDDSVELLDGRTRSKGFDYGAFAGVEAPVASDLFVGVELSVGRTTAKPDVTTLRGVELIESVSVGVIERTVVRPRWNYGATVRAGVALSPGAALYVLGGYGAKRVEVETSGSIDLGLGGPAEETLVRTKRTLDGVAYGVGGRYLLNDRVGLRVEYRRLETSGGYDPEKLLAGILLRF